MRSLRDFPSLELFSLELIDASKGSRDDVLEKIFLVAVETTEAIFLFSQLVFFF